MSSRRDPDPAQQRMYQALRERVVRQQRRRHEQIRRLVSQHQHRDRRPQSRGGTGG